MTPLRIRTASRLHFGLLGWGPQAPRQFGGIGLMVESPGLEIVAEAACSWGFSGPLADRVEATVNRIRQELDRPLTGHSGRPTLRPTRIRVIDAPDAHIGLGVGTQLGLAVARLVLGVSGLPAPSIERLADLSGRGLRSGIGLHGFVHGGLIVDGGRRDEVHAPPMVARMAFPEDWGVLLVRPPGPRGRHGGDERRAFDELPPLPDRVTEKLCRLVLLGALPAVAERDLTAFGQTLSEIQARVGEAFAPVQGSSYASPHAEDVIAFMHSLGLVGAGQSSWGPTLYAFGEIDERERNRIARILAARFGLPESAAWWTRPANHGSELTPTDPHGE